MVCVPCAVPRGLSVRFTSPSQSGEKGSGAQGVVGEAQHRDLRNIVLRGPVNEVRRHEQHCKSHQEKGIKYISHQESGIKSTLPTRHKPSARGWRTREAFINQNRAERDRQHQAQHREATQPRDDRHGASDLLLHSEVSFTVAPFRLFCGQMARRFVRASLPLCSRARQAKSMLAPGENGASADDAESESDSCAVDTASGQGDDDDAEMADAPVHGIKSDDEGDQEFSALSRAGANAEINGKEVDAASAPNYMPESVVRAVPTPGSACAHDPGEHACFVRTNAAARRSIWADAPPRPALRPPCAHQPRSAGDVGDADAAGPACADTSLPGLATATPKPGISHVFTCGDRRWSYHMAGPQIAPQHVQVAANGYKPISWSVPPGPAPQQEKNKKIAKKRRLEQPKSALKGDKLEKGRQKVKTMPRVLAVPCGPQTEGYHQLPRVLAAPYPGAFVYPHEYHAPEYHAVVMAACIGCDATTPLCQPASDQAALAYGPQCDSVAMECGRALARMRGGGAQEAMLEDGYQGGLAGCGVDGPSHPVNESGYHNGSHAIDGLSGCVSTSTSATSRAPTSVMINGFNVDPNMSVGISAVDLSMSITVSALASRVPRSAPQANDPQMSMVCMCRFPGCNKIFAHADGCRKHARKWHTEWLRELDRTTQRCFRWERAWRKGLTQAFRVNRHGAPLPLHVLVSPPDIPQPEPHEGIASLLSLKEARSSKPKTARRLDAPIGAAPGTGEAAGCAEAPLRKMPTHQPRKRMMEAAAPAPRASMSAGTPFAAKTISATVAPGSGGDSKAAVPLVQRVSIADAAAAARPGTSKGSPARKRNARAAHASALSAGEHDVKEAQIVWNKERGAHNALLPHGATWAMGQIEWFVGTWWSHLANASVSTFETSLSHFSAWASDEHGLDSFIAWLPKTMECGEDLVTLQCLELLEYAELLPLPSIHRLAELIVQLHLHEDKQVAETAERVTEVLEELSESNTSTTGTGPTPVSSSGRARKPSVVLQAYDTTLQARGRGRGQGRDKGKKRGRPPNQAAEHSRPTAPRSGAQLAAYDIGGYGQIDDEYEPTGDDDWSDEGPAADLGCVCGSDRHLHNNALSFAGVWVQCELCQRWCHGECTGMTHEEAVAAEYFHCSRCDSDGAGRSHADGITSHSRPAIRHSSKPVMSGRGKGGGLSDGDHRGRPGGGGKARMEPDDELKEITDRVIDERLWMGAAAQGWQVTQEADDATDDHSEHSYVFMSPMGGVFHSRAEAVLHAAMELERTEKLALAQLPRRKSSGNRRLSWSNSRFPGGGDFPPFYEQFK